MINVSVYLYLRNIMFIKIIKHYKKLNQKSSENIFERSNYSQKQLELIAGSIV